MSWIVSKSVFGWRVHWGDVRWADGAQYVSFEPNQYGRVISVGYSGYADCRFSEIRAAAAHVRAAFAAFSPPIHRHGWRGSPERRRLCDAIAAKLNADGVAPGLPEAAP
ncbi:hypothetical protein [Ancylobacter sp. SL191]|uniref:hypothetical protein n=1 Tax=Ancylobacter sp. SL191 TaxID=2995166 RepID=UPI0022701F6A|nr:hypothetical protein [Ancylobacter sp. SL191]WAC26324.1 hypothetical protein OU996_15060 [Ancylobacter sp. SL191]